MFIQSSTITLKHLRKRIGRSMGCTSTPHCECVLYYSTLLSPRVPSCVYRTVDSLQRFGYRLVALTRNMVYIGLIPFFYRNVEQEIWIIIGIVRA